MKPWCATSAASSCSVLAADRRPCPRRRRRSAALGLCVLASFLSTGCLASAYDVRMHIEKNLNENELLEVTCVFARNDQEMKSLEGLGADEWWDKADSDQDQHGLLTRVSLTDRENIRVIHMTCPDDAEGLVLMARYVADPRVPPDQRAKNLTQRGKLVYTKEELERWFAWFTAEVNVNARRNRLEKRD